jgi:hypothetical protein
MADDVRCGRCGEHNHANAAFCSTCGARLLAPDGSAADGPTTSEQVNAPAFGETGPPADSGSTVDPPGSTEPPVVPPAAAAATAAAGAATPASGTYVPPDASNQTTEPVATWSHQTGPPPGPPGQSRSTSVMIAALAVAIVVIVGGIFILLASNRTGDDLGSDGSLVEPEPTPLVTESVVVETTPPETTTPETTTTPPETTTTTTTTTVPPATTAAPVTAAAVPLPTVAPTPAPTLPPAPLPTAAPAPPTRGPGDLGLAQPILNEPCDGRYITFVGSAIGDRPYVEVVSELLATYPGTNYIWTRSCPSLRQEFTNGMDIYGVVFGPYATRLEACNARSAGPADAYVRRISTTDPQDHTVDC